MENDTENNREDRLKKLLFQLVNNLRTLTKEQEVLLDEHTVICDMVPLIELMKETQIAVNLILKNFGIIGQIIYNISLHQVEYKMDDENFEKFMKNMGETQCH